MIGFFGSNPDNPYDFGGEIEIPLNGENHLLTRTSLSFVPAGMKHNPLRIKRIDRPVFHFSISLNPEYSGDGAYK
jgi:glyoxylate utilization-related uncharacterized protein